MGNNNRYHSNIEYFYCRRWLHIGDVAKANSLTLLCPPMPLFTPPGQLIIDFCALTLTAKARCR